MNKENKSIAITGSMVALVLAIISFIASVALMIYDITVNKSNSNIALWVIISGSLGSIFSTLGFMLDKNKK